VDVTNQFEEVLVLVAYYGFVPVLKEMAGAMMTKVECDGIGGEQAPHQLRQPRLRRKKQQVSVVAHKCPAEALRFGLEEQLG